MFGEATTTKCSHLGNACFATARRTSISSRKHHCSGTRQQYRQATMLHGAPCGTTVFYWVKKVEFARRPRRADQATRRTTQAAQKARRVNRPPRRRYTAAVAVRGQNCVASRARFCRWPKGTRPTSPQAYTMQTLSHTHRRQQQHTHTGAGHPNVCKKVPPRCSRCRSAACSSARDAMVTALDLGGKVCVVGMPGPERKKMWRVESSCSFVHRRAAMS